MIARLLASVPPIPAEQPISGPLWTIVVPLVLFGVSVVATYGLYRHFSRRADADR